MRGIFIFIFFVFIAVCSYAQQVRILNTLTEEPIKDVTVHNLDRTKSVVTNEEGITNLDLFSDTELIYFQHLSHVLKTILKSELEHSFIIYLDANTQGLEEIVISASKFEQEKKDIPQKIASLNSEVTEFVNAQTSADLLESTGQVYIQKSQLGGGSPMIRGFSTNRLLITVDGVRMNNAIFRGGNLQNVIAIDPFSIQSAEVTLGASSVIYGSDAIGGVMSFYTQKPKLSYSDSLLFKSNTIVRYASASDEKTGHFDFNLGYKNWAFLTNVSYTDFSDLKMGNRGPDDYLRPEFILSTSSGDVVVKNTDPLMQRYSGYNQINMMQKVRYEPFKKLSFDLGLYFTKSSDVPRYDRLIRYNDENTLKSAEWSYGPQKWFMANLQITKLSSDSNLYDKIKTTVAYQNFQESRFDRDFQSNYRNIREEAIDAYSLNFDFDKSLSLKTRLFYGLEYVYNKVKSSGQIEDIRANSFESAVSRYPNGASWQSAAAYTSFKYKPNFKFVFQSGLRFNHIVSRADFTENNAFLDLPYNSTKTGAGALTGTAGIRWSPNEMLQWKLNASSSFRAPNIDDIGKVFDSEPGSVVVPNENLKPEYAYGGELGLKLNFDDAFVLDMSSYYTYLDDALVRRDYNLNGDTQILYDGEISNIQAIQNASKAWIYGFEVGMKWELSECFKLTSQYSIIGGTEENNDVEVPIRHVAPNFGNAHLVWANDSFKLDAFVNFNNELSFNNLAPSEIEKAYLYALDENGNPYSPSWCTLNFRAQYKISNTTTLTTSLENITDQRYKTYSSGIAAAGRNFILALKYSL